MMAKMDAWIPHRESKATMGSISGDETSKEKEGEKSTTGVTISERNAIGPKVGDGSDGRRHDLRGSYGGKPSADGGGSSSTGGTFPSKLARLEFLKFVREDPGSWFPHVEQFFEY
ncbi:unnamed protein product [Linum trigynum]|uniref:Uncharacterized protein n=1 Tax=Linum trigynum TaxID=586398 RepID=A0AAV2DZF6_9ROSI